MCVVCTATKTQEKPSIQMFIESSGNNQSSISGSSGSRLKHFIAREFLKVFGTSFGFSVSLLWTYKLVSCFILFELPSLNYWDTL